MTRLAKRKKEIEALEGFQIEIFDGLGEPVDLDAQGMRHYGYQIKPRVTGRSYAGEDGFSSAIPAIRATYYTKTGPSRMGIHN